MSEGTPPRKSLRDGAFAESAPLCTPYPTRTGLGRLSRDPYGRADRPAERDAAAAATAWAALSIFRVRRQRRTHKSTFARDPRGKSRRRWRWRQRPAPGSELKFVPPPHSNRSTDGALRSGSSSRQGGGGPRGEAVLLAEIYCVFRVYDIIVVVIIRG